MDTNNGTYEQKIAYARASLWAPFYAVGMVARIQGDVPMDLLEPVLHKLRILYPPLGSRVRMEKDGSAWLTTQGVEDFSIEVRPRRSDDDWVKLFLEQEKIPFAFDRGPLARFFLLRDDQCSDLVAIAPHVVCDGYAMTHVMTDTVALLNEPGRGVTHSSPAPAVTWQTVHHSQGDDLLLRGYVRILNRLWPDSRAVLHQEEYEEVHRCYWARQHNDILAFALPRAETTDLVTRCRQHGVSVTGALVAAFLLGHVNGQTAVHADRCRVAVSVNIRDRMIQPPGRAVGVYASSFDITMHFKSDTSFWELARQGHSRIHEKLKDRPLLFRPLVLEELDPAIADGLVRALSTDQWSREFAFLTHFIKLRGKVRRLLVSNIGRIDLPDLDGPYRLETLIPLPPLPPGGGIALNVLTVDGCMNVVLKFQQDELDHSDVSRIKDRALSYLSGV